MALPPGTQLGSCEILGLIGTGGMGEVYRGRDRKLGREVAVKTLPGHFIHDSERLARFEREAQMLAALNHPNLAAIYELKEIGDAKYLILELVEGETLAERIARGAIPLDEALDIGRQIAEGLEAAHERGIVHRDLKPANVKVTADGRVKVLDFGLAKLADPTASPSVDGLSNSPTLSALQTAGGVILGTAPYMSPEQARGRSVDRRADIWAFGCVLFEMLSGKKPFPSEETVSDTLAAVLKGEPDWRALPTSTPARVRHLAERCLRKDLRRRLPDIAAARIEIEEALSDPERTVPQIAPATRRKYVWPAVAVASLLIATSLGAWILLKPEPQPRVVHVDIFAPDRTTIAAGQPLSPDGRKVAFVAGPEGKRQIWIRPLDSAVAQPLAGTESASRIVWSPDSLNIAFFADGKLKRVAVAGGPTSVICNESGRDAAWSPENVVLIGGQGKPLLRVSALGGQPVPATEFGPNETTHDYPDFLPDGRHFLYLVRRGSPPSVRMDVYVGELDSTERHLMPGINSGARYSPTGHIVFLRAGTLMAQPFDAKRLELTGEAFAVAEQVQGGVTSSFSISQNGSLAYLNGRPATEVELGWFDRRGNPLATIAEKGRYSNVELSPNGKLLAFDRDNDVFVLDLERNLTSRVISHAAADFAPKWSPDSRTIAFSSSRDAQGNLNPQSLNAGSLYERAVGVVAEEKLVLKPEAGSTMSDWSPDGRFLIYISRGDIWALPVSSDSKPLRVTDTTVTENNARVSPDGRWIAYASTESLERSAVYVQSFLERGAKQQVSTGAGIAPRWNQNGTELFYIVPAPTTLAAVSAGTLMSVSIKAAGRELKVGPPVSLFPIRGGGFNVSGDRFLLNVTSTDPTPLPITVINNWAASLKN